MYVIYFIFAPLIQAEKTVILCILRTVQSKFGTVYCWQLFWYITVYIYHRSKNFIKKLPSPKNQIYIKNPFETVIETVFGGWKFVTFYGYGKIKRICRHENKYFVNLVYTAKHHWNLYEWFFLHTSPSVAKSEMLQYLSYNLNTKVTFQVTKLKPDQVQNLDNNFLKGFSN